MQSIESSSRSTNASILTDNPHAIDRSMDSFFVNVTIGEKNLPDFPDPASTTPRVVSSYVQMLPKAETPFGISVLCNKPEQLEGNVLLVKIFTSERTLEERSVSFETTRPLQLSFKSPEIPTAFIVPSTIPKDDEVSIRERDLFVCIAQARSIRKHGPYFKPGIWSPKLDVRDFITPLGEGKASSTITYIFKFRTVSELRKIGMPVIPPDHETEYEARRNKDLYCRCKKIILGGAISCDNERCQVKTWHRWCVGLQTEVEGRHEEALDDVGDLWLCPECRELPRDEIEIAGEDTNEKPARWEQDCWCPVGEAF